MKRLIPPNIRLLGPLLLVIIAIVIFGFIIFKIGFAQITLQNQRIKEGKEEKNALSEKEAILSGVQENILPTADLALVVIPASNSSLAAISQIKVLASEKGLIVSNLNVAGGSVNEKSLKKASINFDVEGASLSIFDFLNGINSVAPLMLLDSMALINETGFSKATVSVSTYWAALPTTIPGVSDGISNLTGDEMNTLQIFTSFRLPVFSNLDPQAPNARENPFN